MCSWDVEEGFDCKGDIGRVVELELVGDLCVGQVLEESLVFIFCDLTLIAIPDGLEVVQDLTIELDGIVYEQRILSNDLFNFTLSRELSGLWLKLENDLGTSLEI